MYLDPVQHMDPTTQFHGQIRQCQIREKRVRLLHGASTYRHGGILLCNNAPAPSARPAIGPPSTIRSSRFLGLTETAKKCVYGLEGKKFWKQIYVLLRVVFPAIWFLWIPTSRRCASSTGWIDVSPLPSRGRLRTLK